MNNKMKLILTVIFTLFIIIGIKIGPVNEVYKLDVQLEQFYEKLELAVTNAEKYADENDYSMMQLQEKINEARNIYDEVSSYIDEKGNPRIKKEEVLPSWSDRLDILQQIILSQLINEAVIINEMNNDINKEKFINEMPSNLPEEWKEYLKGLIK